MSADRKLEFFRSSAGQLCKKITDNISECPFSSVFRTPVPTNDLLYHEVIKNPMDLSTIKKKLKNNGYNTVLEWRKDLELIFDNAIQYNGSTSIIGGYAIYLRHKAEKLCSQFILLNHQNYELALRCLYTQLSDILREKYQKSPEGWPVFECPNYSMKELLTKLTSLEDQTEIRNILKQSPEKNQIKRKNGLNIDKFSRATLDNIWYYLQTGNPPVIIPKKELPVIHETTSEHPTEADPNANANQENSTTTAKKSKKKKR